MTRDALASTVAYKDVVDAESLFALEPMMMSLSCSAIVGNQRRGDESAWRGHVQVDASGLDVRFDVLDGHRDLAVQDIARHAAVANRFRILPCDETDHAEGNIFGGVRAKLFVFHDVQALAFQAEVNVLAVDKGQKNDVEVSKLFVVSRFQLDELRVDLKRKVSCGAVLPDLHAERNRNVVYPIVRRRHGHLLPARYDELENIVNHGVDKINPFVGRALYCQADLFGWCISMVPAISSASLRAAVSVQKR